MSPAKKRSAGALSTVARSLVDELFVDLGIQQPASVHEIARLIFGPEGIIGHDNARGVARATWVARPDVADTDELGELLLVTPEASPIDIAKALAARTIHQGERQLCADYPTPIGRQLEKDETRSFARTGRVFTAKQWKALRVAVAAELVLRSSTPSRRKAVRT